MPAPPASPGICFIITGPGLTNILTPVGQAYSDSVPMLVVASTLDVGDAAQGRGRLHEMQDQRGAAATVTRKASTAYTARDTRDLIAEAFAAFASDRPRPTYIEVPIDVLSSPAGDGWSARTAAAMPSPRGEDIDAAVALLDKAKAPVIIAGGGARHAGDAIARIAEATGAVILTTNAGKGAVPESHPLSAGAILPFRGASKIVMDADVVLAAGTEVSETDLWYQSFNIANPMIRIDIDAGSLARPYPAAVAIRADANESLARIADGLAGGPDTTAAKATVADLKAQHLADDDDERKVLRPVLDTIRAALPADTVVATDMTLIAYSGNEIFPVEQPDCWLHPVGFGTLGYALPAAIGAKVGVGDRPVPPSPATTASSTPSTSWPPPPNSASRCRSCCGTTTCSAPSTRTWSTRASSPTPSPRPTRISRPSLKPSTAPAPARRADRAGTGDRTGPCCRSPDAHRDDARNGERVKR